MRTIMDLAKMDGRVYVYLKDTDICNQFLRDAEAEGFTFGDGVKPTKREGSDIFAVNADQTINYVGFAGHMAFGAAKKVADQKLIRVDYEKYVSGEDEYMVL